MGKRLSKQDRFEVSECVTNYQAYRTLALAVCEQAVIDYKDVYERGYESDEPDPRDTVGFFEEFFKSDTFELLSCDVVDGSRVIGGVKVNSNKAKQYNCET